MIIVDYSRLAVAGVIAQLKGAKEIEVDLARHFLLNMIRAINMQFKDEFGEIVLAIDSRKYWRKDVFPYYKANRAKSREESGIDWKGLFHAKDTVQQELKEFFPYHVIEVEGAEADDIIGALCKRYGNVVEEPILIVASDGDFLQLHHYINVKQYCPHKRKFLSANAQQALYDKIVGGDKKDGVPNIRSADDQLVLGTRAGTITSKFKEQTIADYKAGRLSNELARNWARNEQLINLDKIPEDIYDKIVNAYHNSKPVNRSGLLTYMTTHRLRTLMDKINEF